MGARRGISLSPVVVGPWRSFVALGDSFTEGMEDLGPDGELRGWADRCALRLGQEASEFRYANLAVRGAKAADVRSGQLPVALAMRPELASIAVGVNDMLGPRFDPRTTAGHAEEMVAALQSTGADVILFSFGDPRPRNRLFGTISDRVWAYRERLMGVAQKYEVALVDFWGAPSFDHPAYWSADRLHLSPAGHELARDAALEALGRGGPGWRWAWPTRQDRTTFGHRRAEDARWLGRHVTPWLVRRLRRPPPRQCRRPELELYP